MCRFIYILHRTSTNRSGGIQGGISNGENIVLRVAFKPTSTIGQLQNTVDKNGNAKNMYLSFQYFLILFYFLGFETTLRGKGRHDPCVLPRAVPIVESMVAIVLLDNLMQHHAQCELFPRPQSNLGKKLNFFH